MCRRCFRNTDGDPLCPRCAQQARAYIAAVAEALTAGVPLDDGTLTNAARHQARLARCAQAAG